MNLFPYERFTIFSNLLPEDVILRVENEIEPPRKISFKTLLSRPSADHYFSGYILNGKFSLTPIINYKNSFIPHITGFIEPHGHNCIIHVKMALNTGVLTLMCVWLGFILMACMGTIAKCITDWHFDPIILAPLGMFLFGYSLMTGAYKLESGDAKKRLLYVTEGVLEAVS